MISFKATRAETKLMREIVLRAALLEPEFAGADASLALLMDLTACHANGCPLRLRALLDADDPDFGHDVFGIHRFLDRTTGELSGFFLPRHAAPQPGIRRHA